MTKPLPLFAALLLPLFSPAAAGAQTVVRMDFAGTFNATDGNGHPDIAIGNTFSFSMTFDDSQVTGEGGYLMQVSSILSAEFRVNGLPHPFLTPSSIDIMADSSVVFFDLPAALQMPSAGGDRSANNVVLNPFRLPPPLPTAVGATAEFSDFSIFNGVDLSASDFVVIGTINPRNDAVRGPLTSLSFTAVPEPSAALLGLGAAAGLMLMRRRRSA